MDTRGVGGCHFSVKKVIKKLKKVKKKVKNSLNFSFLGWVGGVLIEKKAKIRQINNIVFNI